MSSREKRLLIFFAVAGFIILNFLGFRLLNSKRDEILRDRETAKINLEQAQQFLDSKEQVSGEMKWLEEHEPKPAAEQDVQTSLQQIVEREAKSRSLTIKPGGKYLPTQHGTHYGRVKFELSVTGTEQALYSWIDRLQVPSEFRAVTFIRLSPNREDDTRIDATLVVEEWFIPQDNNT